MNESDGQLLFSVSRAAQVLDISRSQVYKLMSLRQLQFVQVGSDRRIPRAEVERIAREGTGAARA